MSAKSIRVAVLMAGVAACAADANESRYENAEFGLTVVIPAEAPTCRSQAPEHDGGLDIFLDAGPDGCEALQSRPFIGVYGGYNAMRAPTADDFLELMTAGQAGESGTAPRGLDIPGMRSASSRWEREDGWVDIRVAAQGRKWPSEAVQHTETVPYVNYLVMLHTTRERLAEDVERLRAVLRDVRISME